MANAAMSALEDLMKKKGITPPEEKKDTKKASTKKAPAKKASAKPTAKKETKKEEKPAPAKNAAKAKAPAKKTEAKAPVKKAAPKKETTPKKEVAVEPVVEPEKEVVPATDKAAEGKSICISSYYLPSELRLMKAAAKKERVPLSRYIAEQVRKDLEENGKLYDEVATKMEAIAAQWDSI